MLDATSLRPIMLRRLREVTEVLSVPESAAAVLMREHGWVKERLFERFYEDPDGVLKRCGVYARSRSGGIKKPAASVSALTSTAPGKAGRVTRSRSAAAVPPPHSRRKECTICLDEDGFEPEEMLGMPCGHEFCRDCWRGFIDVSVQTTGPQSVRQTCPQAGCNEVVTEEEVAMATELGVGASPPNSLEKYRSYQLRSFVETNGATRWCPGPGCERVAIASGGLASFDASNGGNCRCDACLTDFCLRCGDEPHAPISCRDLRRWSEKCRNESETANWILANTKPCPKCSSRIEKNQGCNHMACQQCRYEFCWICMGNWADHGANTGGYYRCNKYDPNDDGTAAGSDQSEAARAKRELDRYLHYYKRYHAHAEAQAFARRQLRQTEERMVLLQERSDGASTWTDVEFLKAANEQLVECRRVLKFTYAFAYYLTEPLPPPRTFASAASKSAPPPKPMRPASDASLKSGGSDPSIRTMRRERFEHHQEMLERFTESLSELSERHLEQMDRTEVVNVTRVVDRFMKNVLQYVEDGMEEG